MKVDATNRFLSEKDLEFFEKNGYLHIKGFASKEVVKLFLKEIGNVQERLITQRVEKINGIPLKYGRDVDGSPMIQRIAFTSHYSQVLSEFLKDPRLEGLLPLLGDYAGRIGENEKDGLVVNHYVNSENSQFRQLGWHTDSPRDLFLGSRILPMLNVGLHLDDCPRSNGGLRVLAGTHKQGLFSLFFKKKYFIDNKPDPNEIGFDIEAGDLTVHDGRLWHRVEKSPIVGYASRRRVMYIPLITGAYQPKTAESPMPLYHRLARLIQPKPSLRPIPQVVSSTVHGDDELINA